MNEKLNHLLDGTTMQYTYEEMGTVLVTYDQGCIGFEWVGGPIKGETGGGFPYRARKVGEDQFFVNWHEPDMPGFVTLHIDFVSGHVHSAVLAAYASENEQIHFDTATIDQVNRG